MKKKMMKSTLAVALIAAAAFGGVKTYDCYVQSNDSILLSENIEAMSDGGDPWYRAVKCYIKETTKGVDALICPEGTVRGSMNFSTCPSEMKKANYYSDEYYCLVKIK